jgi:Family of unknown function (DUF5677)
MISGLAMSPPQLSADIEGVAMRLLWDLAIACGKAFVSLGGRVPEKLVHQGTFYWARQINDATMGFFVLRDNNFIASAKLLVRPVIEAVFRLYAVREKPELLYRILYTEAKKEDDWFKRVRGSKGAPPLSSLHSTEWQTFRASCVKEFGEGKVQDRPITLRDLAREAKLELVYDSYYFFYCQHTHGSLKALAGRLDEVTNLTDIRVMVLSSMDALRFLHSLGGDCPDFANLNQRWAQVELATRRPVVTESQ